jgi:hypothetical protein
VGVWAGVWVVGGRVAGGRAGNWLLPVSAALIILLNACSCCPCPHVQSSEAERIGVDQVTKILPTGAASGTNQREWLYGAFGVAVH